MATATMERPAATAGAATRRRASSSREGACAGEAAAAAAEPKGGRRGRPRKTRNKELGRRGEEAAARFLFHRGYDILERNWTCVAGEADIIALDGDALVFVEVKTRTGSAMGFPAEAVTAKKRDRYERIACLYLEEHGFSDMMVRYDVVSIVVMPPDRAVVRHHINAWSEGDR